MDELIKVLRYCGNFEDREGCDESCPYFHDKDCPTQIMNDAADAIEKLAAQLPKWIPVTERLPELDQEVLVYAIGKDDGFIGNAVTTISERFIFRLFPSSDGVEEWRSPWEYFNSNYEITHWMPLPDAPKGEEQ